MHPHLGRNDPVVRRYAEEMRRREELRRRDEIRHILSEMLKTPPLMGEELDRVVREISMARRPEPVDPEEVAEVERDLRLLLRELA